MFSPQASIFDHLESALAIGLYVEKRKLERRRLSGLLREAEMNIRLRELEESRLRAGADLSSNTNETQFISMHPERPGLQRMAATVGGIDIGRIKAKAIQARGIAPKAAADLEKDLDDLIAEGPKLDAERTAAVGMHKEVVAGVRGEFDGLREAMGILSNGGPPLPESAKS